MPTSNTPILDAVVAKNSQNIKEVVALRTSTFKELNYSEAAPKTLTETALKVQIAAFNGKIAGTELALASILLNENIPSIDLRTTVKELVVGVVVVPLAYPTDIPNPQQDLIGKSLMCVSTGSSKGWGFRDAAGNKFYMNAPKNALRPASEAESMAVVDGLLAVRPTQMVKLFSDKSSIYGEE
jgi:hypothetical protein